MKTNIIKGLAILAAVFAFAACSEETPEDSIEVSSTTIVASAAAQQQTIAFTTNQAWEMTSSADWVTVDPASGEAGDAKVSVSFAANDTYATRNATLTLKAGTKTTKWNVEQAFVEVFGAASEVVLSADAQVIEVAVTTNQAFEAASDVDWITVLSTKAAPSTKTVTLNIKANASIEPRTGNVSITAADGSVNAVKINQAPSENAMDLESIVYTGSAMMPYDDVNYAPTDFDEYVLTFNTSKGKVVLAVNAEDNSLPGEYVVDGGADHAAGTFSIKPAEGYTKYYTTIIEDDAEILVADGLVTITESGENLEVSAQLMDTKENTRTYSFSGKKTDVTNENVGAVAYASYYGDYYTHFASKQKYYSITLHPSAPAKEGDPFFYSLTFNVYAAASYDGTTIPTGKYNLVGEDAKTVADLPYVNGINSYPENSSVFASCYSDYESVWDEDWQEYTSAYKNYEQTGGTVEISKGSVEGTYTFDVNIKVKEYWYDEETWEQVYGDETSYSYKFENVNVYLEDNHQEPVEDVDQEFTYAFPQAAYSGRWYGDGYENGGNVYMTGWSSGVNGVFSVQMIIQTAEPYEYVKNFSGRYCNTPIPAGTYEWAADSPNDAEGKAKNCICNVKSSSYKTIKNSYTGTAAVISGGSVTFADNAVTFNLTATTADGKELHYTGTMPSSCYYFQDYSTKAKTILDWTPAN